MVELCSTNVPYSSSSKAVKKKKSIFLPEKETL